MLTTSPVKCTCMHDTWDTHMYLPYTCPSMHIHPMTLLIIPISPFDFLHDGQKDSSKTYKGRRAKKELRDLIFEDLDKVIDTELLYWDFKPWLSFPFPSLPDTHEQKQGRTKKRYPVSFPYNKYRKLSVRKAKAQAIGRDWEYAQVSVE